MPDNEYDVHLWLRIERGGEIAAFRELFDRYYAPLCRFAEFWLRDRASAEEVVLDVYTHVWQHAAELRITSRICAPASACSTACATTVFPTFRSKS